MVIDEMMTMRSPCVVVYIFNTTVPYLGTIPLTEITERSSERACQNPSYAILQ